MAGCVLAHRLMCILTVGAGTVGYCVLAHRLMSIMTVGAGTAGCVLAHRLMYFDSWCGHSWLCVGS